MLFFSKDGEAIQGSVSAGGGGGLKFDQRSQELQAMGPTADGSVPRGIAY